MFDKLLVFIALLSHIVAINNRVDKSGDGSGDNAVNNLTLRI
jgi:hypothetical protein